MNEETIHFNFQARYLKAGDIHSQTQQIWFVLHGYGQLARFFLKKFSSLENPNTCIIAPEGLSHFYLEDIASRSQSGNQKVGATWMTRENRLMDIKNYIHYLNTIYQREVPNAFTGQISVLGFSQGAATASRWVLDGAVPFHRLILWAGIFPPDMDFKQAAVLFSKKEIIEVYGDADPFLTVDRLKEVTQINERLGINPRVIKFKGGHEINSEILNQLN